MYIKRLYLKMCATLVICVMSNGKVITVFKVCIFYFLCHYSYISALIGLKFDKYWSNIVDGTFVPVAMTAALL